MLLQHDHVDQFRKKYSQKLQIMIEPNLPSILSHVGLNSVLSILQIYNENYSIYQCTLNIFQ